MDRLNQIRGEAGDSRDSTLDTSSPPSEAFMSANESSSKYYSLSEVDSTFSISPSKDTAGSATDADRTITEGAEIISTLSPIQKSDIDTYKIGKHIEAANILSGGVNIFDDNDNSYDGDELVIDDNVTLEDDKANVEMKLIEGDVVPLDKTEEVLPETIDETEAIPSKDTEVVLQIDGKNVDAIDIGNGLYLYRKAGKEELAAVQIIEDNQQQPSFKFLKVRENTEGNLEVYEEIEVEIPKEVPTKDGSSIDKLAHVPIKDINKVINEPTCNKVVDKVSKTPKIESNSTCTLTSEPPIEMGSETKSEVNLNGKMMKFNESRKSPLIGTFTPMTYHSTPNKERIPLTKTMVDQQLHPSRHSDNIKKTIEVHTDSSKPKVVDSSIRSKDLNEVTKIQEIERSVAETEECKDQIIVVEDNQKSDIENKSATKEDKIITSEQNQSTKNSTEITCIKDNEKNTSNSLGDIKVNPDQKSQCMALKDSVISKEIKNTNGEITITNQKETITLKDSMKHQDRLEDNKSMLEEKIKNSDHKNIDNDNKISDKVLDNTNLNETPNNKNIACDEIESVENVLITDNFLNAIIDDKEVALTADIVSDEIIEKDNHLESHKRDDATQQIKPVISQSLPSQRSKLSPTVDLRTKTEKVENKSIQETRNLVVTYNAKDVMSNPSLDIEISKNDETCVNVKDELQCSDKFKKNKEIRNESDKPESTICKNENDTSKCDLQNASTVLKNSDLSKESSSYDKDVKEKIQDLPCKVNPKESELGSVSTQNFIHETQSMTKPCIEPPKTKLLNDKHIEARKEVAKSKITSTKANNFNNAVPFGKWTEAHRQEFLNKIREAKVPSNNSNTNQIKQTNDLNRRDILKRFDNQRQSTVTVPAKIPDFGSAPKFSSKMDTAAFVNKSAAIQQTNPLKAGISAMITQTTQVKHKSTVIKKDTKEEPLNTEALVQRRIINSQELIDKTIEGIITRAIKIKTIPDHMKVQKTIHTVENPKDATPLPGSLDDIEMKMNELHGISFTERPVQESPQSHDTKTAAMPENLNFKSIKVPKLLPFKAKGQQRTIKEALRDDISDEEIIEHEPITGDIDASNQNLISLLSGKEKSLIETKKDSIITEKDFDKFARRNSISLENCLTVNFDNKDQHNVVQTVIEKEPSIKKLSRNELLLAESKAKSCSKQNTMARHNNQTSKIPTMKTTSEEDSYGKNYQSKVQIAYHSALTAKRNLECPITIIEDKPVKVVYMDAEFSSTLLNVQGQELSPSKNKKNDSDDIFVHSATESLDSDILDPSQEIKPQEDTKLKSKHQRKQVLTPVEEEPEIQLIEPADLGIKISPSRKRRIEDKVNKNFKNLVPKKSYLLNRSAADEHTPKSDQTKNIFKDSENRKENFGGHSDTITAIDNLVKAAELIETQSENNSNNVNQATDIPQNTPIKRGRGRPRKYPLPEAGADINQSLSPQKKPRLLDDNVKKSYTDSEDSSDGEIVKENWTMGKINENIVCPICNKLFRSENVVFKHVKHCTGPSPNRSDSDKRSPRRLRNSQESYEKEYDSRSDDTDSEDEERVRSRSNYNVSKSANCNEDVIVIEDTPVKEKPTEKSTEPKKVLRKTKLQHNTNNLMCEFCGKTFRQLSYLVNHKLQHKSDHNKKHDSEPKSVFSCEVCKKKFRKLHHLVQHRIIHNSNAVDSGMLRKSSFEQQENKISKAQKDDASAGFRCEPCDKSFRKLHHLVEHRETHDGINKKGNTIVTQGTTESAKSLLAHNCDICKKVFKKLEDLLEHKEQHYETSSEKSDDKSVKSSLSTKDIIHECSLCYMVFPNEHSLNKHTIICLRKKRQSAAKQAAKQAEGKEAIDADNLKSDDDMPQDVQLIKTEDSDETERPKEILIDNIQLIEHEDKSKHEHVIEHEPIKEELQETKQNLDVKPCNLEQIPKKRHSNISEKLTTDDTEKPAKIKKVEDKKIIVAVDKHAPKKKIPKEKTTPGVTKRHKIVNAPLPVIEDLKSVMESSDDEEIRYMLNPNFKGDCKVFMDIRALKRNSLQIERPNSKDLVRRRISLQNPPKMPRLKAKPIETKPREVSIDQNLKAPVTEHYTDSDDSDVKYSFPEKLQTEIAPKISEKKIKRQSMTTKRKSLSGVAKRKSLGKLPTPTNKPKKRAEVEHRCDCGQLFSSAALLSRHTTLAHTPPRIRRRRSPPPDTNTQPNTKPSNTKSLTTKPPNIKPPNIKPPNVKPPNTKIPITKAANTKPATKPTTTKPINKPKPNTQRSKCDISNSNLGISLRSGNKGPLKPIAH